MQLITGGKGFIGMNTARALLELGEPCVLTTGDETRRLPDFLQKELGNRIFVERLDLTDRESVRAVGKTYKITGIIHLSGAVIGRGSFQDTWEETQHTLNGALNIFWAAREWGVSRVSIASTIGVYAGSEDEAFKENSPVPLSATHALPMSKKVLELIGGILSFGSELQVVNLRIGGTWGPLFHHAPSPMNVIGHLIRGAVAGRNLTPWPIYEETGTDSLYVKDTGRAIAMIQLAKSLQYSTYNVGSGRALTIKEVVAAIREVVHDAEIALNPGFDPRGMAKTYVMDTSRLREDTGFEPEYDVRKGVADYVEWLNAGNEN